MQVRHQCLDAIEALEVAGPSRAHGSNGGFCGASGSNGNACSQALRVRMMRKVSDTVRPSAAQHTPNCCTHTTPARKTAPKRAARPRFLVQ
jgi:hypothetical protein